MTILVTGAAGFIGFHVCQAILARGKTVIGLDNLNDYYDVNLKQARLAQLKTANNFSFQLIDITDSVKINDLFHRHQFSQVIHLAAQPGVRYSIDHPNLYVQINLLGFCNIIEACRQHHVSHFIYASSSSVYGANTQLPFSENANTDHPKSLYAASKKANELMAHSYASLFNLPCTGLRFFTVYGPWGRPDMALSLFTRSILRGEAIEVFNHGNMLRDFTYIDDAVAAIMLALEQPATANKNWQGDQPEPASSYAPYRIYNVGNNKPISLMNYINAIEQATGKQAIIKNLPTQPGDLLETAADISLIKQELGFCPQVDIDAGITNFVEWFCNYY